MEETASATVESTAEFDSQPAETESNSQESEKAQATPKAASKPDIKKLLEREKNDPNFRMNDDEQDVYDAYLDELDNGKSKPKTKPTEPKAKEEDEETEEEPQSKPEPKDEEEPEEEPREESDDEPDTDAKAILKDLGAKNLKEASAKLRELRSKLGGKDAQAVARLQKELDTVTKGGKDLWDALGKGDPKAIAFAEKTFGVKFAARDAKPDTRGQQYETGDELPDPEQAIDPDATRRSNAVIQSLRDEIKAMKGDFSKVMEERDRHIQDTVHKQSVATVVDEMAKVAQRIPALKGVTGFREAAEKVLAGEADPRLDVFTELFEIASKIPGATLLDAYDIKRGRDFDRAEAAAKEAGRKEAYNVKPNPSLSGATGGRGEAAYQPVTDALLEKWENDHSTHPKEWYDKDDNLILSKVPKRAQHLFK
jgi:hypothetical protein